MSTGLEELQSRGVLSPLDAQFAATLARLGRETRPEVMLAAALVSRQVAAGHVCLDFDQLFSQALVDEDGEPIALSWPERSRWLRALRRSRLCSVGGAAAAETTPLVLDDSGRLYLRRYWEHQTRLVDAIRARVAPVDATADLAPLRRELSRLFPAAPGGPQPDRQRWAGAVAALRGFCVISGGPGTGKTYTVVKILALLVEQLRRETGRAPRCALMAPTGKAAARLREAIQRAKADLDCPEPVRALIPEDATTIHRALGASAGNPTQFQFHARNPLFTDIVLVDEASMVDLALMSRLFAALPRAARVILLGDKDQLASVEAGAVLGDICNTGAVERFSEAFAAQLASLTGDRIDGEATAAGANGIRDCIVELTHSYRYPAESGIGALARAINAGDADAALNALRSHADVRLAPPVPDDGLGAELAAAVRAGYEPYLRDAQPLACLRAFERFRVLCAHRRGPGGVAVLNTQVEAALEDSGLISCDQPAMYRGRPVLVTRNDYEVGLFNGDVGIVTMTDSGERRVVFAAGDGTLRTLSPARLPPHETVYAMTVHKSQGSELDEVAVVLPLRPSPVVTRELLYTAVTRARNRVTLYATPEAVAAAVRQRVQRASGLRDALWRE